MIKSGAFGIVCGIILADAGVSVATEPTIAMFYITFLVVWHEVLK